MYSIRFEGTFGFIKPYTAVRDSKVMSQRYIPASTIEGIRQFLGVDSIKRYRLDCYGISWQQETTSSKKTVNKNGKVQYNVSIIQRGVLVNPILHLLFETKEMAEIASMQHICLCRKQDILIPSKEITNLSEEEFDQVNGYELQFCSSKEPGAISWGFNRFDNGKRMYGHMRVFGTPSDFEIAEYND